MQGCLDWPSGQELIGWVWEPGDPQKRLTVEVTLDGVLLRRREASDFRPDLPDAGIGDGRHAFSIELPDETFDGAPHTIAVTAEGEHLSGSPLRYQSSYAGSLQAWTSGGREVRGTLTDRARPHATASLTAELWSGSRRLVSTRVQANGTFVMALPQSLTLPPRVALRVRGCATPLVVAEVERQGHAGEVLGEARELLTGSRVAGKPQRDLAEKLIPILSSIPADEVRLRVVGGTSATLQPGVINHNVPVDLLIVDGSGDNEAFEQTLKSVQNSRARQAYEVQRVPDRHTGFGLHGDRDCVVLAAGTTVTPDWLDRLRHTAYAQALTASASPLVSQVPAVPPSVRGSVEAIAEPSPVCTYYRRDAINEGMSRELGWRNLATAEVWVSNPGVDKDITQSTRVYAAAVRPATEVVTLRCDAAGTVWIGSHGYHLPGDREALLEALRGVKRLRFTTAVNVPPELFALGIEYEIRVEDYSWICPRTNLVDETGRYCGEPALAACERCLARLGAREDWGNLQAASVAALREQSAQVFARASAVAYPSSDTAVRMQQYFNVQGEVAAVSAVPALVRKSGTVAVAGDAAILDECRYDAFKRGLPLVFGGKDDAAVLLYANPAPDTSVVASSLPIVTFDIGATGDFVRRTGFGTVLPLTANAAQINDALVDWMALRPAQTDDLVDIVMPVYSGVAETRTAIASVLASSTRWPYELVVVFDNPADAEMRAMLAEFDGRITVLENDRNLGFVASANRGMALHPGRDVLLLNSDIVAPGSDWLNRIRRAAYAQERVGTVTPFSNNATICSYPRFCRNNELPEGWSVTAMDAHCRETLSGVAQELPTTVGFCMYIRAACLAETGLFDVAVFGQGYGEENDFCMRAAARGWKHVLAADVFVQHVGGVSFGAASAGRAAAAYEKLKRLHPAYGPTVEQFLAEDPVLPLRRKLDLVRLKPRADVYCLASNALPGGTERHVQELAVAAREQGQHVIVLRYSDSEHVEIEGFDNQRYRLPEDTATLRVALRELGVTQMHVHQTVDAPTALFDLGLPYDITVHDYAWICPQIKLIDRTGRYCGEPAVHVCEACYATLGPHEDWPNVTKRMVHVAELRAASKQHLERAQTVWFPSEDAAQRMSRYASMANPKVRLHDECAPMPRRWRKQSGEVARVVFIGGLTRAKGFDVLYGCALDAQKRGLPVEFVVAGACADARQLKELGVRVLGPYQEAEIRGILQDLKPHLAFFPGQWPETFSYTLSIAFAAGIWPVAYDLGAIAERVKQYGYGRLMPVDTPFAQVNDILWSEA
ncbi:hypothetical protein F183_A16750 [Bryobacterales bacterium F-183]|nr:hypothetical protein F183_A16750 [Bryobacterales bacterium F-183]